jgi:SAM-dependent methyltransferase
MIAEGLERNPALPLIRAAAEQLPCADGSRDGIFCECVLSLLEDPPKALAEFGRVLRVGGYLILSDLYTRDEPMTRNCLRGAVPRVQVEAWLAASGFSPLLWEDHTSDLKEMAARLILSTGSLEGFCSRANGENQWTGYYLLVARKK